jgi:putative tryptophan/tyrosine transport system substrate-binding protein
MRRRDFINGIVGTITACPLATHAQPPSTGRRIGVLMPYAESDPFGRSLVAAFRASLGKLGWVEGRYLQIDLRWAAGNVERMRTFAKELIDLRPDAILAASTPVTGALASQTRTIPIVFALVSDPIGSGFAASLSRPGGNVTGFTESQSTLGGKWVQLLRELDPRITRVALLFNPTTAPPLPIYASSIDTAAQPLGVEVRTAPVQAKEEIEGVIGSLARDHGGGLIVMPDLFTTINRGLIIALAASYRVPAIYETRAAAEAGGLISYGSDFAEQFRGAAGYIDRILKQTRPEDLPIQQPEKFELVINLKTAKALGLTLPQSLLATADDAIE